MANEPLNGRLLAFLHAVAEMRGKQRVWFKGGRTPRALIAVQAREHDVDSMAERLLRQLGKDGPS